MLDAGYLRPSSAKNNDGLVHRATTGVLQIQRGDQIESHAHPLDLARFGPVLGIIVAP